MVWVLCWQEDSKGAAVSCADDASSLTVASSVAAGCTSHPFECTRCTDSATSDASARVMAEIMEANHSRPLS